MRIRILIPISIFALVSLGSCKENTDPTNYIIPGEYVDDDIVNDGYKFYLNINSITQEEFINSNGMNVIQDAVNGDCYKLDLHKIDESNKKTVINFKNFTYTVSELHNVYIALYKDEYENTFWPVHYYDITDDKPVYKISVNCNESESTLTFSLKAN